VLIYGPAHRGVQDKASRGKLRQLKISSCRKTHGIGKDFQGCHVMLRSSMKSASDPRFYLRNKEINSVSQTPDFAQTLETTTR